MKRARIASRCAGSGKLTFHSRSDARVVVRRMGGHGQVYRCHYCGAYHVSSQPKRVTAAIRYLLASLVGDAP